MICPLKVGKVSEFTTHKRNIDAFGVEKTNILIAVDNSSVWFNIIISVDNTKLPCYTLPPTQHHSFSRNLTPLFSSSVCCVTQRDRKSVTMIFALLERRGFVLYFQLVLTFTRDCGEMFFWIRKRVLMHFRRSNAFVALVRTQPDYTIMVKIQSLFQTKAVQNPKDF